MTDWYGKCISRRFTDFEVADDNPTPPAQILRTMASTDYMEPSVTADVYVHVHEMFLIHLAQYIEDYYGE